MKNIVIIGTGNVAWHLCKAFISSNVSVVGVYSRKKQNRNSFAQEFNITEHDSFASINESSPDLVLVAVNDDNIVEVAQNIDTDIALAYTSGSVELSSLDRINSGVFYPLQSFTKNQDLNIFEVPFFIEATDLSLAEDLFQLAWKISRTVKFADSKTRSELHIAAVFANNFSNYMFTIAEDLLKNSDGNFDHLKPLINQSINKLKKNSPKEIQTGPARRGDQNIIEKHKARLNSEYAEIYRVLSESIQKKYNEEL